MKNALTKYLIIKMILGKSYSASFDEIDSLEKFLRDNGYKIKLEPDNDYIEHKGNYFEANYNLNREVFDINGIKMKEYKLLKSFISKQKEREFIINDELLNRCKEIYVYLIEMLTCLHNNPNLLLEELGGVDRVPGEVKKLFNEFSVRSAYLLENDNELVISNENLDSNMRLSYKTYFNNVFVTKNIKELIFKYTNDNSLKYLVDFGNAKYFGMPSYKQDMLVLYNDEETIDPIYIPRLLAGEDNIVEYKNKRIEEARKNIKRLKL